MRKVALFYYGIVTPDGQRPTLGGVQTYIRALSRVISSLGAEPILFQIASGKGFETDVSGLRVVGVPGPNTPKVAPKVRALYAHAQRILSGSTWSPLFCADHFSIPNPHRDSILIQHGIGWDLPSAGGLVSNLKFYASLLRYRKLYLNCPNRVCVDYNFLNWWKATFQTAPEGRNEVIPNFGERCESVEFRRKSEPGRVRILFARRFQEYRGVRIMAEAAERITAEHENVEVTFAGEGPLEEWLRSKFQNNAQITITRYGPDQAQEICSQFDIATVPSLGSEGTSLSVIEAMGAGCAVVATYIGGCSNLILSGYNGLLVSPTTDDLTRALLELVQAPAYRLSLGQRAWESAEAFSRSKWEARWGSFLKSVFGGQ